jgi:hypothetical protein
MTIWSQKDRSDKVLWRLGIVVALAPGLLVNVEQLVTGSNMRKREREREREKEREREREGERER